MRHTDQPVKGPTNEPGEKRYGVGPPVRRRWRIVAVVALAATLAWIAVGAGSVLIVQQPVARPDAIVSLGSHEWERLPLTARLATSQPGAIVLLTLPEQVTPFNCHDCANRADRLNAMGVAEARLRVLLVTSPGTYGEALAVLSFAREAGLGRLVIVTSPYHTRRALATFRKVFEGTGVTLGIEPAISQPPARPVRWWLQPYDRAYVGYEWAALAYYAWEHGVSPLVRSCSTGFSPTAQGWQSHRIPTAARRGVRIVAMCVPRFK